MLSRSIACLARVSGENCRRSGNLVDINPAGLLILRDPMDASSVDSDFPSDYEHYRAGRDVPGRLPATGRNDPVRLIGRLHPLGRHRSE